MGKKDTCAWEFYSDPARYADVVNGLICGGEQVVGKGDLHELDSRIGQKSRDLLREVVFGNNIAVIGIENQEHVDYSMPQRMLLYEAKVYEKLTASIQADVKKDSSGISASEYLGRFRKDDKFHPHATLVLYYGQEPWDGEKHLHKIIDFTDIPESLQKLVQDYQVHVVDVRRLEDTSVFKTDVKLVFDFIRYSDDSEKLERLVKGNSAYQELDKKAFEFISYYGDAHSLRECREYKEKGQVVNMCKALDEIYAKGEVRGEARGIEKEKADTVRNALQMEMPMEQIMNLCRCSAEYVERIRSAIDYRIKLL